MVENFIIDKSGDNEYFIIVPTIIDDMGLSPHTFRLYLRIKRRACKTGKCVENTCDLAGGCRMTPRQVAKAKRELMQVGLIETSNKQEGKK